MNARERVAVVGGGMLGLTLAFRLAQSGRHVTVIEAADRLGGLAGGWQLGPITWDRYYHVTLLSDSHLRSLLRELGVEGELRWRLAKTGFFADGDLHSLSSAWEFLRFPPLSLWSKLRLGATILRASKLRRWQPLEEIPVADWLRRWSGRKTYDKIWLPLLRAKLGDDYRHTNAAFIWSTIARMYAARRTGLKQEMFGYLPGGYARVLAVFAKALEELGVEFRLGQKVRRVEVRGRGSAYLGCDPADIGPFDRIVLTVPAPLVPRLCPQLEPQEAARFAGVKYLGIICASLLLERPLADYYITNIADERIPFTAVIEMSALVDRDQFGGRTLVYLPKYVNSAADDFAIPDEVLRERWLAALRIMYPGFDANDVLACELARTRYVMPIPTLGYSRTRPRMRTSLPGIYAVNSTQIVNGTLNVNETVKLAEESALRILADAEVPGAPLQASVAHVETAG